MGGSSFGCADDGQLLLENMNARKRNTGPLCSSKDGHLEVVTVKCNYEGWNFNSSNYLFTTDTR